MSFHFNSFLKIILILLLSAHIIITSLLCPQLTFHNLFGLPEPLLVKVPTLFNTHLVKKPKGSKLYPHSGFSEPFCLTYLQDCVPQNSAVMPLLVSHSQKDLCRRSLSISVFLLFPPCPLLLYSLPKMQTYGKTSLFAIHV